MNACSERQTLSLAADRICRRNSSVGNARLRSILCLRIFDPLTFGCGAFVAQLARRRQCSSFVVGHLPPKIPESAPLPLCSNTSRTTSTRAALLCDSCLQLSSVVANCRLLLTFVASCFFVANCCRLSACPKLSHSLPICPKLSQTVPSCPSNDFLHSGSAAVHKILSYFFLFRGSLVSEGFASADSKGKHGAVPGSPMAIGPKLAHCLVVVEWSRQLRQRVTEEIWPDAGPRKGTDPV